MLASAEKAINDLQENRVREGVELEKTLVDKLRQLEQSVINIEPITESIVEHYKQKLMNN